MLDEVSHLNLNRINRSESKPAFNADQSDEDPIVCLMEKFENSEERKNGSKRFVDSGCSNHMTFN